MSSFYSWSYSLCDVYLGDVNGNDERVVEDEEMADWWGNPNSHLIGMFTNVAS